ncbi:MAG: LysE family translocator [Bdellovibrionales bacterium]
MRLIEFALASLVIELTPGPNMSYLATVALTRGFRPAFAVVAGVATGLAVIGMLAAFGLAEFVTRYPSLDVALRWGGVLFMLWLSFEAWRDAGKTARKPDAAGFRRGLVTNLLNPKSFVFYVTVMPEFADAGSGNLLFQNLVLAATYVMIATATHIAIILAANRIGKSVIAGRNTKFIGRAMAGVLAGVAVWLALDVRS